MMGESPREIVRHLLHPQLCNASRQASIVSDYFSRHTHTNLVYVTCNLWKLTIAVFRLGLALNVDLKIMSSVVATLAIHHGLLFWRVMVCLRLYKSACKHVNLVWSGKNPQAYGMRTDTYHATSINEDDDLHRL